MERLTSNKKFANPSRSIPMISMLLGFVTIALLGYAIFLPWGKIYFFGRWVVIYLTGIKGAVTSNTFSYWWDSPFCVMLLFAFVSQIIGVISIIFFIYNIFMISKNDKLSPSYISRAKWDLKWGKLTSITSIMTSWGLIVLIASLPAIYPSAFPGNTSRGVVYPQIGTGTFFTIGALTLIFIMHILLIFKEESDSHISKSSHSKQSTSKMIRYNIAVLIHNIIPFIFGILGTLLIGLVFVAPLAISRNYEYSLSSIHRINYAWGGGIADYSYSWWDHSIYKNDLIASHLNGTIVSTMTMAVIAEALAMLFSGIALYVLSQRERKELKMMKIFLFLGGLFGILTIGLFWFGLNMLYSSLSYESFPNPSICTYCGVIGSFFFFVSAILLKYVPFSKYNIFSLSE